MLTRKEYNQLDVAICYMHSPMSVGGRETCFKWSLMQLLKQFTEKEEDNETKQG